MTLVDTAAPVEAPLGFERTAWARLEPQLDGNTQPRGARSSGSRSGRSPAAWRPWCSRRSWPAVSPVESRPVVTPAAARWPRIEPERVLQAAVGDHLDRTQMMLVELANADTDHADVLAGEQARAADLVAVNRLIRQSAEQSGDAAIVDVLEDLERVLLEIANAPANATSNDLTDLQSRITTEDLLFRLRVIASEMRQRTMNDREAGDRVPAAKMPMS